MILPITGNVAYSITLDPTTWIFDDRKILLSEAFANKTEETGTSDDLVEASKRWDRAVNQRKSNTQGNRGIARSQREEILKNSYVMPIHNFVAYAEMNDDAVKATLVTNHGNEDITLDELRNCLLRFSIDGKAIKEDGPVHFFYQDGSNRDNPIKGVHKIIIT